MIGCLEKDKTKCNRDLDMSKFVNEKTIEIASSILSAGGVIAIPTDTIYGFCCKLSSSVAIERIYDIKQRKSQKPMAICVSDFQDIYR